uniref:Protein FLOWERING LOCUS T n=1 Tax=Cajanus cajan TaxID=3821 RepID=A0A151R769_CAJCA|nr:Protein FLOWERING LOCUS T [Cajanus cajan]
MHIFLHSYLLIKWYIYIGQEIVEYECPRPTSGIHRIVFVLFRQRGRQIVHAPRWRKNFNTKDFAEAYNLGLNKFSKQLH